jgi:DNA-binding NtrC family response regulator
MISPEVWEALESYDWPGNVRQLKNLVERVVALDADGRVTLSDLPPEIRFAGIGSARQPTNSSTGLAHLPYADAKDTAVRAFQATYLRELLDAHDGNISKAADTAGVSRRTLHRWLAEFDEGGAGVAEDGTGGSP